MTFLPPSNRPSPPKTDGRPLHAVLLDGVADAARLLDPLARALDGTGPAILPLDAGLPAARLRQLIDVFQPDAVIGADGETRTRSGQPGVAAETAVIVGTSGSTGEPKGVELSAAALIHSARASLVRAGARPGERGVGCLPGAYGAGLQVLVRSLVSGTEPVIAAQATAGAVRDAADAGCAHVSVVPTQLVRLLRADAGADSADGDSGARALARYRCVLVGGAAAGATVLAEARAAGIAVVTTYGMSETCGGCVYDGVPLDGVTVRAGEDGRLRISGPVLMNRYHGRPDLTAAVFDDHGLDESAGGHSACQHGACQHGACQHGACQHGACQHGAGQHRAGQHRADRHREFVTSDLGQVAPDGRVTIRGRADDVINTGGHKVVPGEVAAVLAACPGVREVVVVGRPDPEWGERVTAVVVPADWEQPPGLELLRMQVSALLPRYACPSEVVLTEAIPVLPSGKPDLAALKVART